MQLSLRTLYSSTSCKICQQGNGATFAAALSIVTCGWPSPFENRTGVSDRMRSMASPSMTAPLPSDDRGPKGVRYAVDTAKATGNAVIMAAEVPSPEPYRRSTAAGACPPKYRRRNLTAGAPSPEPCRRSTAARASPPKYRRRNLTAGAPPLEHVRRSTVAGTLPPEHRRRSLAAGVPLPEHRRRSTIAGALPSEHRCRSLAAGIPPRYPSARSGLPIHSAPI